MVPVESSSPCLVHFLTKSGAYPPPDYGTGRATGLLAASLAVATPFGIAGQTGVAGAIFGVGAAGAVLLAFRRERNLPVGARRHREAHKVRERMRSMVTMRTLHRALDQGLLDMLDEAAKQYLRARGHAGKVAHPLTAQADAAAIAAMDDLLLEVGMILPHRLAPRTFGDALNDAFVVRTPDGSRSGVHGLSFNFGRLFGTTPPPEPDFETMRRVRPHVQALADLAAEIERTLPSLVQTMDVPEGPPPVSKTLDALREHRETREALERELRLGG